MIAEKLGLKKRGGEEEGEDNGGQMKSLVAKRLVEFSHHGEEKESPLSVLSTGGGRRADRIAIHFFSHTPFYSFFFLPSFLSSSLSLFFPPNAKAQITQD